MKKYFFSIGIVLMLFAGCTTMVPAYEGEKGEVSVRVNVYGDSTSDIECYINYVNNKIVAVLAFYAPPDSIDYLRDIDFSIEGLEPEQTEISIVYGEMPGTKKYGFETTDYVNVRDSVIATAGKFTTQHLSFSAGRQYAISQEQLPDKLELNYTIVTNTGDYTGKVLFNRTEREIEQPMRFH